MTTLNPTATDGDKDGLVQDATKFERPATPKGYVLAKDGDNYQTIAESLGAGADILEKAQKLHDLNNGLVIYPGSLVKVSGNA